MSKASGQVIADDSVLGDARCLDSYPDIMSVEEAAPLFNVGVRAMYTAIREKRIPAFRMGRHLLRIPKAALRRFFEYGVVEVTPS